jgi:murein DD-endopeptidase MepM/ murein hydrolase activator NlpD
MKRIFRKALIVFLISLLVAGTAVWAIPGLRVVPYALSLYFRSAPQTLPVPVEGVRASGLVDTWGAPRSGGRRHKGIDIFGKRGIKIRSTTEGVVTSVGENRLGGRCVWVMGPGGYLHYYAHLDNYGNVKPGLRIHAGHFVGIVGNSGNAKGTPPHLHYGIYKLVSGACNPYPLLKPRNGD